MIHAPTTGEVLVLRRRRTTSIIRRIAWLNVKLGFIGWGLAMMLVPPTPIIELQGRTFQYVWTGLVILGAALGAVGICVSMMLNAGLIRRVAVPLELTGLTLMFVGPLVYFITQAGLLTSDLPESFQSRFALVWYAYIVMAYTVARFCMVAPRFHRAGK